MKINKLVLSLCFALGFCTNSMAQEELGNLWSRSTDLLHDEESNANRYAENVADEDNFIFLIDTLELFHYEADDFAKNKIKSYSRDSNRYEIFDSVGAFFRVNQQLLDTFNYRVDTVYNLIYNPFTQKMDSHAVTPLNLAFFEDTLDPFLITRSKSVYPAYYLVTENGVTRRVDLSPDSVLVNLYDTFHIVRDDAQSRWISNGGFWNSSMSINPPTVGVITLDGLDDLGKPYDNTSRLAYGQADFFESKPIDLYSDTDGVRYTINDSIYLSFFFQPQGHGDLPEAEDSLILEFWSVSEQRWNRIWSSEGIALQEFEQVYIHIADTLYFKRGFRFRFRNFATLSGNFDHWHIDYVRLGKNRTKALGNAIADVAFVEPIRTLLNEYTVVPWKHYQANSSGLTASESKWLIRNMDPSSNFLTYFYWVYQPEEVNPFFKSKSLNNPTFPASDTVREELSINSSPNNFTFPGDTNQRKYFEYRARLIAGTNINKENDTLTHYQIFDNFYAYDDGSAEKTYHLNLVGTSVVTEFSTPIEDTLRAIKLNFVETFEVPENQQINLLVYTDLDAEPVYQSGPRKVIYSPAGKYYRYTIDPVAVNGKFYVGYQQLEQQKTFVGYDVNYNNQQRTFLKQIGGTWFNSIFEGTLMLRADFSDGADAPLSDKSIVTESEVTPFYPNPARNQIRFNDINAKNIKIYNLSGVLVKEKEDITESLNLGGLSNGFYLVQVNNEAVQKLVIYR